MLGWSEPFGARTGGPNDSTTRRTHEMNTSLFAIAALTCLATAARAGTLRPYLVFSFPAFYACYRLTDRT